MYDTTFICIIEPMNSFLILVLLLKVKFNIYVKVKAM